MKRILGLVFALTLAAVATVAADPDPECENACFEQYLECARGCVACDQCSCELALCRAGCGVPWTGC